MLSSLPSKMGIRLGITIALSVKSYLRRHDRQLKFFRLLPPLPLKTLPSPPGPNNFRFDLTDVARRPGCVTGAGANFALPLSWGPSLGLGLGLG